MTLITRYDPFREFVTLQDRMSRLFRDPRGSEGQDESLTSTAFAPPVDVYEDEHNVTLKIEVPGIDEKDIDVAAKAAEQAINSVTGREMKGSGGG